jgi:hypothetical protein
MPSLDPQLLMAAAALLSSLSSLILSLRQACGKQRPKAKRTLRPSRTVERGVTTRGKP